jgi:hypothetical protein
MTKNCKFCNAILSAFYNISQRNFGILLISVMLFHAVMEFCLDLLRSKFWSIGDWSIAVVHVFSKLYRTIYNCEIKKRYLPKISINCISLYFKIRKLLFVRSWKPARFSHLSRRSIRASSAYKASTLTHSATEDLLGN